jgi:Winged helix DNA-binding domain
LPASEVLSRRALNRALLARQMLLSRQEVPVDQALERLVGIQAQEPQAPYLGLWTRLERFDPNDLSELIAGRGAVRGTLMRCTVHLDHAKRLGAAVAADGSCARARLPREPVCQGTHGGRSG